MQTNNSTIQSSSVDAPRSVDALDQAILAEGGLPLPAADASSDEQAGEGDEKDPRQLSAAVAASAYGAYALHITRNEMDALAAKVMAFVDRLSELRRHAGVHHRELTTAGSVAYHGLNNIFEDLAFTQLNKDYEKTEEQLCDEIEAMSPFLAATRDTCPIVGDLHSSRHGARMLHNATKKIELARGAASADHDEILNYAKSLQRSEYEPFSQTAVSGLKSATEQFTAVQAAIRKSAVQAHHALLDAVDHAAIACGTYDQEIAVSIDAIHAPVAPCTSFPTGSDYAH